jgi:hypothetical protein
VNYREKLIREAENFWANRDRLPIDLFAAMVDEGIEVAILERQYIERMEAEESNG